MRTESISLDDERTTYALLLQGINVGGHSPLPMTVLRNILRGLGFSDVRTYLQSGNAVFTTSLTAAQVAGVAANALGETLGRDVAVVVRTADQLLGVVEGWPFDQAVDPTTKHVMFLRQASDVERLGKLLQETMGPEQYWVRGTDIYQTRRKTPRFSEARCMGDPSMAGTGATARNWNTVLALRGLVSERR